MPKENMKPRVCLETTIVSYLTVRSSRDLIAAGHQKADRGAAVGRLAELARIPVLEATEEARALARAFVARDIIPKDPKGISASEIFEKGKGNNKCAVPFIVRICAPHAGNDRTDTWRAKKTKAAHQYSCG
jgi:hypothetical protein